MKDDELRESFLLGWKYAKKTKETELTPGQVEELFPNVHVVAFLNGFDDCIKGDNFRFTLIRSTRSQQNDRRTG